MTDSYDYDTFLRFEQLLSCPRTSLAAVLLNMMTLKQHRRIPMDTNYSAPTQTYVDLIRYPPLHT